MNRSRQKYKPAVLLRTVVAGVMILLMLGGLGPGRVRAQEGMLETAMPVYPGQPPPPREKPEDVLAADPVGIDPPDQLTYLAPGHYPPPSYVETLTTAMVAYLPGGREEMSPAEIEVAAVQTTMSVDSNACYMRSVIVRQMEEQLRGLGYKAGAPDGILTSETVTALLQFQKDHALGNLDCLGLVTREALETAFQERKHPGVASTVRKLMDYGRDTPDRICLAEPELKLVYERRLRNGRKASEAPPPSANPFFVILFPPWSFEPGRATAMGRSEEPLPKRGPPERARRGREKAYLLMDVNHRQLGKTYVRAR